MAGQSRTLKLSILADVDQLKKSLSAANDDGYKRVFRLDAGISAESNGVARIDAGAAVERKNQGHGAMLRGIRDDNRTEGLARAEDRTNGTRTETCVVTAGEDHKVRTATDDHFDDIGLTIRLGRPQRTAACANRSSGSEQDRHGEGEAHEQDYWASLREGWVCWRKVRVGANSPSLWPTMFSVT